MWVVPNNFQPSLLSARDMVASKEDLTLPGLNIESSLMWRSKPTQLRTWSQRWNRVTWLPRLFGRILKPSRHTFFETALTSSLAATRANRLARQESDVAKPTRDTYGPTLSTTFDLFAQDECSLKTSKGISRLDSPALSATWKNMVLIQRGEYSARAKSARLTRESGSTLWATPRAREAGPDYAKLTRSKTGLDLQVQVLLAERGMWPTPRTTDTHQGRGAVEINGKLYRPSKALSEGRLVGGANLADAAQMWPTPSARDHKGGYQGGRIRNGKVSMDTLDVAVQHYSGDKNKVGHLNPAWVEWLMGVPTGWTELGSWETE
jgi:hypothetical protein